MNHVIRTVAAAAMLAAVASSAQAQANVSVKDAWVRATVPQQKATGAFMQLQAAKDSKFVSASSPLTPAVEVHEMAMQGDVMRMRAVDALALPAGRPVALKPGGYHLMLMDLRAALRVDARVPLTLQFRDAQGQPRTLQLSVPVAAQGGHKH